MFHSSAHLIQEPFFPPGLLQSQATKDDGSNRWSKCYAHLAIICEPTAPAIAYGLGINVLIFDLPLQARLLMSLISEKKIGWDGPHGVTLGTQSKFGTCVHLTNETIA